MMDVWYWDSATSWAIDELYRYHVPANIKTYGELENFLIAIIESDPENSVAHEAARDVLQSPGGVAKLASRLRIETAK